MSGPSTDGNASAGYAIRPPFDAIFAQPTAAGFLSVSTLAAYQPQAYLFTGPVGSGKTEAALLTAQALLCLKGGADGCEDCQRVGRQSHPDLIHLNPEGSNGYLIEQIQALSHDAWLSAVRSKRKVYIVHQADRLTVSAANAFLKLLEEPPGHVVFILVARGLEGVLATVRSRCQAVPFRAVPPGQLAAVLAAEANKPLNLARQALAYSSGSLAEARRYLSSAALQSLADQVTSTMRGLARYDALDVLEAARSLVVAMKLPLDDLRNAQERQLSEASLSLAKPALASFELGQRRELSQAERNSARWTIRCISTYLRDCLMLACGGMSEIVHPDEAGAMGQLVARHRQSGQAGLEMRLARSLQACQEAMADMDYNVSVQSVFEYLLLTLNQELGEH